jgi:hypothetical protein
MPRTATKAQDAKKPKAPIKKTAKPGPAAAPPPPPAAPAHTTGPVYKDRRCDRDKATPLVLPPWFGDLRVVEAIFHRVNELRVLGALTERARQKEREEPLPFSSYVYWDANIRRQPDGTPCVLVSLGVPHRHAHWQGFLGIWMVHLGTDFVLLEGLSNWDVYDGRPLVNPARQQWQQVVRWMNAVRPFAWHWLEEHQKRICADGGAGREQDRAAFADEFGA